MEVRDWFLVFWLVLGCRSRRMGVHSGRRASGMGSGAWRASHVAVAVIHSGSGRCCRGPWVKGGTMGLRENFVVRVH